MSALLFILLALRGAGSTKYVVDGEKGDDTNNGHNPSHAFKTIQHCVDSLLSPGDSCNVRAGRYHEEVTVKGLRGSEHHPFVIKGYEDERPIWDGSTPIQPAEWKFDLDTGICSAAIEEDIFALLLDDELLTAARWPNALWSDKTAFNNSFWGKCDQNSERGNITDDGTLGLSSSGINATGAMAILNIGSFNTYVRQVLNHVPGSASFTYNDDLENIHWTPRHNQYYLEAALDLLDTHGEWFYDVSTKILYLIPPVGECPDPSTASLRGRTMDYSLTITNTTQLTIANMTFLAATINAHSVDHEESHIDEIHLESLKMLYQSSSKRMLGINLIPNWTKLMAYANMGHGVEVRGRLSVVNCTFEGGEGTALQFAGEDSILENNLFLYNDWTGHDNGNGGTVLSQDHSTGDHFIHNTLMYNGRSAGVRLGNKATIEYNEIIGQCEGKIQNDGAGIQVQNNPQDGVKITNNWVHDSPKSAVRFDGGGLNLGFNGYQGFNVAWNTGSLLVKGDNHTVMNNLALDRHTDDGKCSLCVIYRLRHDPVIQNNHTSVLNNGATQADGGTNVDDGGRWPIAGEVVENNYSYMDIKSHLVDASILDFRPIEGGILTSGSEIIGPYYPGTNSSTYWIPGRRLYTTSSPIPPTGSTVPVSRDALMFLAGFKADKHHFYLGLFHEGVESADMDAPEFQYSLDEGNMILLPELDGDSQYFWRVDSQRGGDIYKGDIWNFFTQSI